MRLKKKAVFFTIDAVMAISLILVTVMMVSSFYVFRPTTERIDYTSYDILQVLGEMKVSQSNNPYVQTLFANGTITRGNNTLLEQIGEFWADGDEDHARELTYEIMRDVFGNDTNWALSIAGDLVYETSSSVGTNVRTAKRMISGLEKMKPTYGYTARALMTRMRARVTNGIATLGGFVGQGNITIPLHLTGNISLVSEIYLELSAASNFTLYINDNATGTYIVGSGGGNPGILKPDIWILNGSERAFIKNFTNNIKIVFANSSSPQSYVSGGFIKVKYTTSNYEETHTEFVDGRIARHAYEFPGIYGAINLFDSFYVPGPIRNMSIRLHYFTNHSRHNNTIIFVIGDHPLLMDNESTTPQDIMFNHTYLSSVFGGYSSFNDTSVPIRFGFANISGSTGLVDVALVTDRSGSMAFAGWQLQNDTSPQIVMDDVYVPNGGWSGIQTFTVPSAGSISNAITFEAENYSMQINRSSHYWQRATSWSGYSGTGYVQSLPNNGANINSGYQTTSPELRYTVNIPQAGTYYVWLRMRAANGNDNSAHVGIDGTAPSSADRIEVTSYGSWVWTRSTIDGPSATLTVGTPGVHTVHLWMREDGLAVDKFLLTTSSSFVPSGSSGGSSSVQRRLAVSHEWARFFGYNGSEASELQINVRRPDGTWIIGGGSSLPANPSVSGVDPPTASVGTANEYMSGRSTKPQVILVDNPEVGNWAVAVHGLNFRPYSAEPPYLNTTISIFIDTHANSSDNVTRGPTTISMDAAKQAAHLFTNLTSISDQISVVSFSTTASTNQVLTTNKNLVHTAINGLSANGGTRIDLGIAQGHSELISVRARSNATQVMILITDGQNDVAPSYILDAADAAKADGIRIFTIGLSSFADVDILEKVASNPGDAFYAPTGAELETIYEEISRIIDAQYHSQVLFLQGVFGESVLYPDSSIEFYYNTSLSPLQFGEIPLTATSQEFVAGGNNLSLGPEIKLTEWKSTSYSANNWTSKVFVDNLNGTHEAFSMADYSQNFTLLGDPFLVHIPLGFYQYDDSNLVSVFLTSGPNETNGSRYNRLMYSVRINGILDFGSVVGESEGCKWTITYEDETTEDFFFPLPYFGNKTCYYANSTYDPDDARDIAVFSLFSRLDFNKNGKLEVKPDENNLRLEVLEISNVPSLWGPSLFEVKSWI